MLQVTSLLIVALVARVSIDVVLSSPVITVHKVVPMESSGAREAIGPESNYELPLRPSVIPYLVPRAAGFDIIDVDHDGRVTSEEWRDIFIKLLAFYDSNGDHALTMSELLAHNLTPPLPTTRLAPPPPSKHRNLVVDFKGQLAKKEQLIRQRDQLYARDRPRAQHRKEHRTQGRP